MLEARVKQGTVGYPVTACSGKAEFVQREWRVVPVGYEAEAEANPLLETREYEAKSMEEALPVLSSMAKERKGKKPAPVVEKVAPPESKKVEVAPPEKAEADDV